MTWRRSSVLKTLPLKPSSVKRSLQKAKAKTAKSELEMSSAQMDPHDKMRSRDLSKVARGEQAPRPPHAPGTVSPPPQNEATFRAKRGEDERFPVTNEIRHCFNRYLQYHKCLEKNRRDGSDCDSLRDYVRSVCPQELVEKWEEERKCGTLPSSI